MSRLSIEISTEQHQQIKALAALQGKSIKDYILGKLFPMNQADEQTAWADLEQLLLARIQDTGQAAVSPKTIQQITDEVLKTAKS